MIWINDVSMARGCYDCWLADAAGARAGFGGINCQFDYSVRLISTSSSVPSDVADCRIVNGGSACHNGGTCRRPLGTGIGVVNASDSYRWQCDCVAGFTGQDCSAKVDVCTVFILYSCDKMAFLVCNLVESPTKLTIKSTARTFNGAGQWQKDLS